VLCLFCSAASNDSPADLLHNLNLGFLMGNQANNPLNTPLRPSPLGAPGREAGSYPMENTYTNPSASGSGDGYIYPQGVVDFSTTNSDTSPVSDPSSNSSPTGNLSVSQSGQSGQKAGQKPVLLSLSMSAVHPNYMDGQHRDVNGSANGQGSHDSSPYSGLSNGGFTIPSSVLGYAANAPSYIMNAQHVDGEGRSKGDNDHLFYDGVAPDSVNVLV